MDEDEITSLHIECPRGIPDLPVLLNEGVKWTCEDVKWHCIDHLKSVLLTDPNEELLDQLPAFGLLKTDAGSQSIWLSPNHVFERTNKKQVYKFRIRHRPPSSSIYIENRLFSEFFIVQAVDDFLNGALGQAMATEVQRGINLELILFALLLPSSLPWNNSHIIDRRQKGRKFGLFNYHKTFSESIYNVIIVTKSKLNRIADHVVYHSGLCQSLKKYKSLNNTVLYYKKSFLELLMKSYPSYCFERYSAAIDFNHGENIDVNLILYNESAAKEQQVGIYINETSQYGLEEIDRVTMTKWAGDGSNKPAWKIELDCNGPKTQNSVLKFDEKEVAMSFITMLQGYMTLCIRPDANICRQFTNPSDTIRDSLKSFCPLNPSQAREYIKQDNHQKAVLEWCTFLIYQSKTQMHYYHVATRELAPVMDIKWLDGKGFLLFSTSYSEEFSNYVDLRKHLISELGQQLRPAKVSQRIDESNMFFIENSKFEPPEEMTESRNRAPAYILEEDMGPKENYIINSEDDGHLKRWIVNIGEEKKVVVELGPKKKAYMEALYCGMSKVATLFRLHPSSVLGFYGSVFSPTARATYVLEHSPYGDLIQFLNRNRISTLDKMRFALEVVKIFCILTQPGGPTSGLHGNLRGHNFWVFKKHDRFYLKLGDPGLVQYYNTLLLEMPNNDKRIPWLSPERSEVNVAPPKRRMVLSEVTVASECYAVATTIAEIFHGTDDFRSVLKVEQSKKLKDVFSSPFKHIPPPEFAKSEDETVMQSVQNVTTDLWEKLALCWHTQPNKRPLPQELKSAFLDLEDDAKVIQEETVFSHLKIMLASMCKDDNAEVHQRIAAISTMSDYHKFMKEYKQFYIEPSRVICTDVILGTGTFGCVYKGKFQNQANAFVEVAIKKNHPGPKKESNPGQETLKDYDPDFIKEFELCASLDHPNIVKALHYSYTPQVKPSMLMEYMNFGSLSQFVKRNDNRMTDHSYIKELLDLSLDVARGMEYMEKQKVVHCDLAARNVLLNKDPKTDKITAKVSDFGLAKILNRDKDYYYEKDIVSKKRPLCWYAPEYLVFEKYGDYSSGINYTTAGDIWAYGTTLWEMFSKGKTPQKVLTTLGVKDMTVNWLFDFYMEEKKRWPQEDNVGDDIYKVMLNCWSENENDRPRFSKIQKMIVDIQSDYK